jgi:hypothetical protein
MECEDHAKMRTIWREEQTTPANPNICDGEAPPPLSFMKKDKNFIAIF